MHKILAELQQYTTHWEAKNWVLAGDRARQVERLSKLVSTTSPDGWFIGGLE